RRRYRFRVTERLPTATRQCLPAYVPPRPCAPRRPALRPRRNEAFVRTRFPMAATALPNSLRAGPDADGHFGIFGGRYVAETLMPLVLSVEKAYAAAKVDPAFQREIEYYHTHYIGRPSPLYFAQRLTEHFGGAKLYFKRDELNHTGAHKIN